jgi:hypothetical protein
MLECPALPCLATCPDFVVEHRRAAAATRRTLLFFLHTASAPPEKLSSALRCQVRPA